MATSWACRATAGSAEYNRLPAGWVVPLPAGLSAREAMVIGTAGFTAGLSVARLEARGLTPSAGPVLVTGAQRRGRPDGRLDPPRAGLRDMGVDRQSRPPTTTCGLSASAGSWPATRSWPRAAGRSSRSAGRPRSIRSAGRPCPISFARCVTAAAIAATGNTGGAAFSTTVFPFILRDVSLIGIDSSAVPIEERRSMWERLATDLRPRNLGERVSEIGLDGLEAALDGILAGQAHGRWIVRLAE